MKICFFIPEDMFSFLLMKQFFSCICSFHQRSQRFPNMLSLCFIGQSWVTKSLLSVKRDWKRDCPDLFLHGHWKGEKDVGNDYGCPTHIVLPMELCLLNTSSCIKGTSKASCPVLIWSSPPSHQTSSFSITAWFPPSLLSFPHPLT